MTTTITRPLPKPQGSPRSADVTTNPVESDAARVALVEAYKALRVLDESGSLAYIAEALRDIKAVEQADAAIATIEDNMSPNLLVTVLPAYSKVRFATDRSRPGEVSEGIVRDGAWGLHPERTGSTERRITTNGWEFFVDRSTVFTFFEVTERG